MSPRAAWVQPPTRPGAAYPTGCSSETGLTLIELMIAVAILAMISTMVWSSFSQTTRTKKVIEASQDRYHECRLAMSRIARELSESFLTKNFSTEGQLVTTPKSVFVSEDRPPFDRVDFVAFAHHRLYRDANESDQSEISYFVTRDLQDPQVENLVRRESRRVDEDPRHGGAVLVLVPDVTEFDLTYYDTQSQQWVELWDSSSLEGQPDRMPAFAKVVLVVKDGPDRTLRFVEKLTFQLENPIPEPRVRTLRIGPAGGTGTGGTGTGGTGGTGTGTGTGGARGTPAGRQPLFGGGLP